MANRGIGDPPPGLTNTRNVTVPNAGRHDALERLITQRWMMGSSIFDPATPADMAYQYPPLNGTRRQSAGAILGMGGRYMGHDSEPSSVGTYSLFEPRDSQVTNHVQTSTTPAPSSPSPLPGTLAHARSNRNPEQADSLQRLLTMVRMTNERSTFTMTSEDFPALPGTTNEPTPLESPAGRNKGGRVIPVESNMPKSDKTKTVTPRLESSVNAPITEKAKDKSSSDYEPGMSSDRFGMVHLVKALHAGDSESQLPLGMDLWSLGVDLLSKNKVVPSFRGPLHQGPGQVEDIEYNVPSEYVDVLNSLTKNGSRPSLGEKLAPLNVSKYKEDLLFYLFYQFTGDLLQILAAAELYSRDWRFHLEEKVWVTRPPDHKNEVGHNWERGHFYVFEPQLWKKTMKRMYLDYTKLEGPPVVPTPPEKKQPTAQDKR